MMELTVPEDVAEEMVEQKNEEIERITNVLNSFRSNSLTDTEAYQCLERERDSLINDREHLKTQINEAEEEREEHNDDALPDFEELIDE